MKFKDLLRLFQALCLGIMCAVFLAPTASAAEAEGGANWETATIEVIGYGASGQDRVAGFTAAKSLAQRDLVSIVNGVQIDSETTVQQARVVSDVINTKVSGLLRGAKVVDQGVYQDGTYWVKMSMPMYGSVSSLASAVMQDNKQVESFPEPVTSVAPSEPNVNVNVTVNTGNAGVSSPSVSGSSAAPAPAGKAVGGFTGLIVDCRGLDLNPVMSPVIKNDQGAPIYGYKNLDSKKVIHGGMAGYVSDMSAASRAGNNPLVVKAVAVDNHNSNPVVTVADANRVLIENKASGFLDNCAVVFVR